MKHQDTQVEDKLQGEMSLREQASTLAWYVTHANSKEEAIEFTFQTLTTAIAEARRTAIEEVVQILHETDPSSGYASSPAYWGNELRRKIKALTTLQKYDK